MPRRNKPTASPWHPQPRLRSEPEDDDTPLREPEQFAGRRSAPCGPCLKQGIRTPAHRILHSGVGLCEDHYREWEKGRAL
jgi:hypothetical protein